MKCDSLALRISEKPFLQLHRERASSNIIYLIIGCKFFFLFIGREFTTWPANYCLQIIVCSCAMSSDCVWPNKWAKWEGSHLISVWRSFPFPKILIKNHKTIIKLGYGKIFWFVSVSQINYLPQPLASNLTNHNILLYLIQQLSINYLELTLNQHDRNGLRMECGGTIWEQSSPIDMLISLLSW